MLCLSTICSKNMLLWVFTARNTPPLVIQPFTYDALPRSLRKKYMQLVLILDVYVQNHRANGLTVPNKNRKYVKSGFPKKGKNAQIPTTLPNNMVRYINVKLLYTQASFKSCFWSFISTENATNDVFPGVNVTSFGHFWRGLIVLRALLRRRFPDQTHSAALSKLENFTVKYKKLSYIQPRHYHISLPITGNQTGRLHRYRATLVKGLRYYEQ